MGIRDLFGRRAGKEDPADTVRFFDAETERVVNIPRSELRPGVVEAQVEGIDGLVWLLPQQLSHGPIRHPPFEEEIRDYIRQIHSTFIEHRDVSIDEWEDGFRRDAHPTREIALWSHAADVYTAFAEKEPSPERRGDIYHCIVACLTAGPDGVWNVMEPKVLARSDVEAIVSRFFGRDG